jgi:hypothetical protein
MQPRLRPFSRAVLFMAAMALTEFLNRHFQNAVADSPDD